MIVKLGRISKIILHGGLGKCTPITAGSNIITTEADNIRIAVVNYTENERNVAVLRSHERPVVSMTTSKNNSILCSCSEDKVILWDLESFTNISEGSAINVDHRGIIVGEKIGYVSCCSISCTQKWLALCEGKEIWIVHLRVRKFAEIDGFSLELQFFKNDFNDVMSKLVHVYVNTKRVLDFQENLFQSKHDDGFCLHTILKTDSNTVNMCSFSLQDSDVLVTVEDSNHFQIWNIQSASVLYRSTNFVSNYITCCSFDALSNNLLIGTSTGMINVYTLNDKRIPTSFIKFNVSENIFADGEKNLKRDSINYKMGDPNQEISQIKKGCIIFCLNIYFQKSEQLGLTNEKSDRAEQLLADITSLGSVLLACCNLGIVIYSCKTCDCIGHLSFLDPMVTMELSSEEFCLIDDIVLSGQSSDEIQCWIKTPTSRQKLFLLTFTLTKEDDNLFSCVSMEPLSFLSRSPIKNNSPLLYDPELNNKSVYSSDQLNTKIKTVKVKSSGYGRSPRRKMFIPMTNGNKKLKIPTKSGNNLGIFHTRHSCNEKNVFNYGLPENKHRKATICKTTGISIQLTFSGCGDYIACNSESSQVCVIPANTLQLNKSTNLSGHNSTVNSLDFNMSSKWLLSSSADSTVRVWDWRNQKCILKIGADGKTSLENKLGNSADPVVQARFFYLDKFILLAKKNQIDLYHHFLHKENSVLNWPSDEMRYKKLKSISFPTQHVTCFSAANTFHSRGCSNRNIIFYDVNHQKFIYTIEGAHSNRAPHRIVQQTGSTCPAIPALASGVYNLFLSSAISDGVKLWDLRTLRCVQKYNRHLNRMYFSGIDFSPCGRFVAVCSEDKRVYVYDTRNCENFLGRLGGFSDAVMDVAFSPCMTQLAASSLNGNILTFTSTREVVK